MSLIVAVHVHEGIVMASDRRSTLVKTEMAEGVQRELIGAHITNTTEKTFLCPNGMGISTCGAGTINREPITGFIQSFIREEVDKTTPVSQIPSKLIKYFSAFNPVPETHFIIAGYESVGGLVKRAVKQKVFRIAVVENEIEEIDTNLQGATWDGEIMTLTRLLKPMAVPVNNNLYKDLPPQDVLWEFFTLQEAVDFARFAVETTINTMRFVNVVETVGGSVDILVITPTEAKWLQHEELR